MKGTGEGKRGKQTFSFIWNSLIIKIVFGAATVFVVSCTKPYEFNIGNDFLEAQTKLQVIDTFSVDLSTILLDSLATSNTSAIFAGNYEDTIFGSLKCESYFELAFASFPEIDEKAIYDSSAFILSYTGAVYGDSTALMNLSIHRLSENIEPFENNYIYNNSSFDYESEPVGSVSFYPTPASLTDTAVVVSVNTLGEELFDLIRNKDERVSSQEWFSDYLKGFIITPGTHENKAIVGFKADETNIILRIYYHFETAEEPQEVTLSISSDASAKKFNHVDYDFSDTFLNGIQTGKNELSSSATGGKGYMQGLIGILPKIRFPSLGELFYSERWKILKAELVIEPVKWSYDIFKLPEKLYIYDTDKENRINSILRDDDNNALTAIFSFDDIYGEETSYTYDITNFLIAELEDAYFDYEHGLLLGLDQAEYTMSLDRLFIEGEDPPVKLRLYYLSY